VILFEPGRGGYFLLAHLREGLLVHPGDVVPAGTPLGRVGASGSAARPGHGRHLHLAYKEPGRNCGVDGVLVAQNPIRWLRAALARRERADSARSGPGPETSRGRS
jgi:murein DD-endopeptidase MepM/ murein hydrolase activator NlpD